MEDIDARIAEWCREHDGVITQRSRKQASVSKAALARRAEGLVVVREHHGVFRHAAHPRTFESGLRAAIEAAPVGGAFVSGPSLMRLYSTRGEWTDRPEIMLVGTEHLALEGVRVRRIDRLDERDTRRRGGLPALAPPLGLLTLGASCPPWKVESAVHDMCFQGFTMWALLVDVLVRYGGKGRRGAASFRAGVDSLDPKGKATQTNFELQALRDMRARGVPDPELQYVVIDPEGRRRRLDFAWPELKLNVETDGDRWHLNPQDRRAMAKRDVMLHALGWTVIRIRASGYELDPVAALTPVLWQLGLST